MRAPASDCYDPPAMVDHAERPQASHEAQVLELSERLAQRERELSVLAEVAIEIHSTESAQSVFEIALDKVREKLGLSAAWIITGDAEGQQLHLAAARGISERYGEVIREHGLSECLCKEVMGTGQAMQARNTTQCPR